MLVTPDDRHLLVTEDSADEDAASPGAAGLEVFRIDGAALRSERFMPLPGQPVGIALAPGSGALAIGLGNALALLDLDSALSGQAKPAIVPFTARAGPENLTASPDGRLLFATSEFAGGGGEALIIDLTLAKARPAPDASVVRGAISTPLATPDLALSPDGSRLYVVAEVAPSTMRLAGAGQPALDRDDCHQGRSGRQRNGVLYTFDVQRLIQLSARSNAAPQDFTPALLSRLAAGCSPVRLVVSADGQRLYVTARGQNQVLVFDARRLESDPDHALLHAFASGGAAPVGLQLIGNDRWLVVANSNRFGQGPGAIAMLDAETGRLLASFKAGTFPRNVAAARNGVAFVADFGSNAIEVLAAPTDSPRSPPRP